VSLEAFAPAKVNLFLHVGPTRPDGYHPICSLFVFADVGDRLTAEPASAFSLQIDGPFAAHAPAGEDNLVVRALAALLPGKGLPPLRLTLHKALPAAAGLGGGSSDAAAALRLADRALGLETGEARLHAIAAELGSDVPACLDARPVLAQGRGEQLSPGPALPPLPAVIVRPGVGAATGPVYRAFDEGVRLRSAEAPAWPNASASLGQAAELLASTRNDLEAPAVELVPEIGAVLEALRGAPEVLFARMSGSGSACFALCRDLDAAKRLAGRLRAGRPDWWVAACRLGGPWT
jgi:4-diphosphocytidyl-2-C-methyl-D-erythritol kinase